MSKITLKNMYFHAYHGCLEHEKELGNTFIVNISFEVNTERAGKSDQLHDTLNYQQVYNTVKKEMDVPSKLIEHVGQRIIEAVFNKFTDIQFLEVEVEKQNPPLGGKVECVSIQLSKNRSY